MRTQLIGKQGYIAGAASAFLKEYCEFEEFSWRKLQANEDLSAFEEVSEARLVIAGGLTSHEFDPSIAKLWEYKFSLLLDHLGENEGNDILLFSSIHAESDSVYGEHKRNLEDRLFAWSGKRTVVRLPNMFGLLGRNIGRYYHPLINKLILQTIGKECADASVKNPKADIDLVHISALQDVIGAYWYGHITGLINVTSGIKLTVGEVNNYLENIRDNQGSNKPSYPTGTSCKISCNSIVFPNQLELLMKDIFKNPYSEIHPPQNIDQYSG